MPRPSTSTPSTGSAPQVRPARRAEIRALTGLRIVAALWVLAFHLQAGLGQVYQPFLQPVWPLIRAGWLGVDLFFVLSGFVMALTYVDTMGRRFDLRSVGVFLWARLSRVWPLWVLLTCTYAVFLAWSGFDDGAPADRARSIDPVSLLDQLLMVQMWHREQLWGSSYVVPGWSLSVEFFAYVAFPLVVLGLYRVRRLPALVLGALAVLAMTPMAYQAYATGLADYEYSWLMRIAGAFVSGCLVYLFVAKAERSTFFCRISPALALLAAIEIVMVCWWASWRSGQTGGDYYGVAVLAFPVLVAALAVSQTGMATVLARETMVMGGKISFALYLVHSIVFEVAGYLSGKIESMQSGSPLWIALQPQLVLFSLVLAYLLWRFVEEPARKWMRRIGPKSAPRSAAHVGGHQARPAGAVAVPSPRHQRSAGPARAAGHVGTSPGMTAVPGPATVRMLSQVGPDRR